MSTTRHPATHIAHGAYPLCAEHATKWDRVTAYPTPLEVAKVITADYPRHDDGASVPCVDEDCDPEPDASVISYYAVCRRCGQGFNPIHANDLVHLEYVPDDGSRERECLGWADLEGAVLSDPRVTA